MDHCDTYDRYAREEKQKKDTKALKKRFDWLTRRLEEVEKLKVRLPDTYHNLPTEETHKKGEITLLLQLFAKEKKGVLGKKFTMAQKIDALSSKLGETKFARRIEELQEEREELEERLRLAENDVEVGDTDDEADGEADGEVEVGEEAA